MITNFDAIIIGSGQAGNPLASAFANKNMSAAVIEKNLAGGSCINYGCTPSKTMRASARIAYLAKRSEDFGIHASSVKVNMKEVYERKKNIVESFRKGTLKGLNNKNITLFRGDASFIDEKTIQIKLKNGKTKNISGDKIFINTGGRPSIPQIKGLKKIPYLDSTSIMELKEIPEHLLIIGGGYIGLEFGQMFKRFGSNVSIIQKGKQLLSREDPDITEEIKNILLKDGIKIYLNAEVLEVSSGKNKTVNLKIKTSSGEKNLKGSHILAATGHEPNTENLNLFTVGIKTDKKGYIKVNNKLETNVKNIYALGDVKGGPAFTHISFDDFRIIRDNILEGKNNSIKNRFIPYVVFIDPQLGRIGITEKEAKEKKIDYSISKMPMSSVSKAIEVGETRGLIKIITDKKTKKILGAAVLGIEGGELMAMIQIAMMGKLKYNLLQKGIFAHPTLAESLNNVFSK